MADAFTNTGEADEFIDDSRTPRRCASWIRSGGTIRGRSTRTQRSTMQRQYCAWHAGSTPTPLTMPLTS